VPILFPKHGTPTFDAYLRSQSISNVSDEWQIDTLAISASLRNRVRQLVRPRTDLNGTVDPAINFLIMATNGIAYESKRGHLTEYPIPKIPLPPNIGQRLLDLGCSWGRWSASAARLGYEVYGIDPSLGAVLAATRLFRELDLRGRFACGDGRNLPFPDRSFDVVYSYSVLQHLSDEDADAAWSEIGRVLKPSGLALVQMANRFGVRSLYHLARRGFRKARAFEVRYRSPTELKKLGMRHVGPSRLFVDCFGGLGLQMSDRHLYCWPARYAVTISELLKKLARVAPPLTSFADSLFISCIKGS
jgi:SAM-dependent methyltransferase